MAGYRTQDHDTVDVISDRRRLTLLVVPPETDPQAAQDALAAASRVGSTDGVEALLHRRRGGSRPAPHDPTAPDPGRGAPSLKEATMAATTVYVSRYDQRVRLVADALTQNSKLGDKAAVELAKHVLNALDLVPEKVR